MARRRRYATRTRYVKKYVRRRASRKSLNSALKPIAGGVITGVIQSVVPNNLAGGLADSAVPLGVGYALNNNTLMTLGGYQVGLKLANMFTGNATGGSNFFE